MIIKAMPVAIALGAFASIAGSSATVAQFRGGHGKHGSPNNHPYPTWHGSNKGAVKADTHCRPLKGYSCDGSISRSNGAKRPSGGSRLCLDGDQACYRRNGER